MGFYSLTQVEYSLILNLKISVRCLRNGSLREFTILIGMPGDWRAGCMCIRCGWRTWQEALFTTIAAIQLQSLKTSIPSLDRRVESIVILETDAIKSFDHFFTLLLQYLNFISSILYNTFLLSEEICLTR